MSTQQQRQPRAPRKTTTTTTTTVQPAAAPAKARRARRAKQSGPSRSVQTVTAPAAVGRVTRNKVPQTRQRKDGICVIHSEFITDVVGPADPTAYSAVVFQINAGLAASFPWLSQMAPLYESYRFKKLHFRYQPTSATTTDGTVYLGVEYDPNDAPPSSKQQIASWDETVSTVPWKAVTHSSKALNLNKRKSYFTRSGQVNANLLPTYDVGYLVVATSYVPPPGPSGAPAGEIWVDYEVELMTPQLNNLALNQATSAKFSGATPLALTTVGNSIPGLSLVAAADNAAFTFPNPWQGLVEVDNVGIVPSWGVTGSATITTQASRTDGTGSIKVGTLSVPAGGTLNITTTDLTAINIRFAQYDVSFS
jgi:hypothetical protein